MNKKITLYLLLFCSITYGQIFNRSIAQSGYEGVDNVSRQDGFSYVLMNSTDVDDYYGIYKMDDEGNLIDGDTLELSALTSAYPVSLGGASIYNLPNNTFYVYGSYILGCDVIGETGSFVAHYDQNLNLLKHKLFQDTTMSFGGITDLFKISPYQYAISRGTGLLGFDSSFTQTFYHPWTGSYLKGAVGLPNNLVLEVSQAVSSNVNASYLYNTSTNVTTPGPQMDGLIYDVNDTSFARIDSATLYMHHKSSLVAYDSINISNTVGFVQDYAWFQEDVILLANLNNYAVVSVVNLQLLKADSLKTKCDYLKYAGAMSYKDSVLIAATQMREGRFQIESFNIYQPKAPAFNDVLLTVENTRMVVKNITVYAPTVRGVYSENDWKISVVNLGQDTIKEIALKHYDAWNPYCLPYVSLILEENLNLAPLDTFIIELDSMGHGNTIFSTTYTSWLHVAVVMVNKNIVKSNEWGGASATVLNVGIEEEKLSNESFKVFPNPTSGFINLELPQNFEGTIKLYSLSGKLLQRQSVVTQEADVHSLSLESYPAGVYLIQIESDGRRFQKRIIKN